MERSETLTFGAHLFVDNYDWGPFPNVPLRPEKASEASTSTTMIPLVSNMLMTFVMAALPIFQSVRSLVAALKT